MVTLFPFDRTPSELFKLFENVFCVSDSATILKSYKDEEIDLAKQVNDVKDKIKRNTNKIAALEELEKDANLDKIKVKLNDFEKLSTDFFTLVDDYESVLRSDKFNEFTLDEKVIESEKDYKFLLNVSDKIKFYKSLPESYVLSDTLNGYLSTANDFSIINLGVLADNFSIDKSFEVCNDSINLYVELLEDLKEIEISAKANDFCFNKECKIEKSITLEDYINLKKDLTDIMYCYNRCKQLTADGKELVKKIEEKENKLKEYKVCPLCGHELNGEENVR